MYLVFLVAISGGVERFVGVRRFANEPNIAMSRTKRATKLRYIPVYEEDRKKVSEWTNIAKTLSFGSPEGVLSTSSGYVCS